MTSRPNQKLGHTVLAATQLCPQIVRETVKAGHGPRHERHQHLDEAKRLLRLLLGHLDAADVILTRDEAREASS